MTNPLIIACPLPPSWRGYGQRRRERTSKAQPRPVPARGRVPRISRLMALALRLDELVRTGVVADYAELARLGHVSRARISQILNLLHHRARPDRRHDSCGSCSLKIGQLPDWDVRRAKVLVFSGCESHPATWSFWPVAVQAARKEESRSLE